MDNKNNTSEYGYQPTQVLPYPSPDVSPAQKQSENYCIKMCKAVYYDFIKDRTYVTSATRTNAIENRLYAKGTPAIGRFKQKYAVGQDSSDRSYSFVDLDVRPLQFTKKFIQSMRGYFEKQKFKFTLQAIDKQSDLNRKQHKAKLWAAKQMNATLNQGREIIGLPQIKEPEENTLYTTKTELDTIHSASFKLSTEAEMIKLVQLNMELNEWDEEMSFDIIQDILEVDFAAVRHSLNEDGTISYRRVLKENYIGRNTKSKSLDDSDLHGEIIRVPFRKVIKANPNWTETQLQEIAEKAAANNGIYNAIDGGPVDINDSAFKDGFWISQAPNCLVDVMDIVWSETEVYYKEVKKTNGNKRYYNKPYGYQLPTYSIEEINDKKYYYVFDHQKDEKREISYSAYQRAIKGRKQKAVEKTEIQTWYQAKWIVGTEMCYDYGRCYDIMRDNKNLKEAKAPFVCFTTNTTSFVDSLKPHEDAALESWLKIQTLKSSARPSGLAIDVTALEDLDVAGEKWDELKIIEFLNQKGHFLYSSEAYDDELNRARPITELRGGLGTDYMELMKDISEQINFMRFKSIPDVFDGTNTNPRQGLGTAEIAMEGATNTLMPVVTGYTSLFKRLTTATALRVQQASRNNKLEIYKPAVGEDTIKIIEVGDDLSLMQMGIETKMLDGKRYTDILQAAQTALNTRNESGQGQITYPDYLLVVNYLDSGNIPEAERILQQRINKRSEEIEAARQARAKEALEAAQVKGEEDRKTLESEAIIKLESEKDLYAYKALIDVEKAQQLKQVDQQEEEFKLSGELLKISQKAEEDRETLFLQSNLNNNNKTD